MPAVGGTAVSRLLLDQWQASRLRPGAVVERDDGHEQPIDRWLAGWRGVAAPWLSAWRCRRLQADVAAVLTQDSHLAALDEAALDTRIAAAIFGSSTVGTVEPAGAGKPRTIFHTSGASSFPSLSCRIAW